MRNKQSRDHTCPKCVRRRKCQHLWVTTISVPVPKWKRRRSDSCASIPRFLTRISLHSHKYPFEATGSELPAITRGRKKSSVVVFLRTLSTAIFGSIVAIKHSRMKSSVVVSLRTPNSAMFRSVVYNHTWQDEKFRRCPFAYGELCDFRIGCLLLLNVPCNSPLRGSRQSHQRSWHQNRSRS